MPITLGIDVGTTTITALALDARSGDILACATAPNDAEMTWDTDKARGRSEWDAFRMAQIACRVLKTVGSQLGPRKSEVAGIGMTGQQHGVVLVDARRQPVTPLINWQDRRGHDPVPNAAETYLDRAVRLAGPEAVTRAGCALSAGFLGTTLFWLKECGYLLPETTACFVTDYLGTVLTGQRPVTDPTMGASSGLFGLVERGWLTDVIAALGLPPSLFPEVRESGDRFGELCPEAARATGLPDGLPVFVGLGDNQASFLGSVAYRDDTVLVNVGTGGQVARYTVYPHVTAKRIQHEGHEGHEEKEEHEAVSRDLRVQSSLETRPFPRGGYLLVHAGLCGGRSYAILQRFFQDVGRQVLRQEHTERLYEAMNALALSAPRGADGLRCEPFFAGSRAEPGRRAVFTGVSAENFTPAHMVRALLEGMASAFRDGYEQIRAVTGSACTRLVGAGNGLRENPALAQVMSAEFGLPLAFPAHREEAAYGAALVAACGAGLWPDLVTAGRVIRYEHQKRIGR